MTAPATPIARHRTAQRRSDLSSPVRLLMDLGFLDGKLSLFDYGCGRGDDLRFPLGRRNRSPRKSSAETGTDNVTDPLRHFPVRPRVRAAGRMPCDHLDAAFRSKSLIEGVAVVGAISDQALGCVVEHDLVEGCCRRVNSSVVASV